MSHLFQPTSWLANRKYSVLVYALVTAVTSQQATAQEVTTWSLALAQQSTLTTSDSQLQTNTSGASQNTIASKSNANNNVKTAVEDDYDPVIAEIEAQEALKRKSLTEEAISSTEAQRPVGLVDDEEIVDETYHNTYLITPLDRENQNNRTNPLTFAKPINANKTLATIRAERDKQDKVWWQPLRDFYNYIFSVHANKLYFDEQLAPLRYYPQDNATNVESRLKTINSQQPQNPNDYFTVKVDNFSYKVRGLGNSSFQEQAETNIYAQLARNIADALNTVKGDGVDGSSHHLLRVQDVVTKAAAGVGFYNSNIRLNGTENEIDITINPHKPVTIGNKSIIILRGAGTGFSKFQNIDKFLPQEGEVLNSAKFEQLTSYLNNTALAYGYFDAEYDARHILLDSASNPTSRTADWLVDYYTGQRYSISAININNDSIIDEQLIRNMIGINVGDPYDEEKIDKATRDLQNSRYFGLVRTQQLPNVVGNDVTLNINLEKSLPNSLETSLGYDSSEGFRGKLLYSRLYLNSKGSRVDADGYLSKLTQRLELTYRQPWLSKPQYIYTSATISAARALQSEALGYSRAFSTSASVSYIPVNSWQVTGSVNLRNDLWFNNDNSYNSTLGYWNFVLARQSLYTSISLNLASNKLLSFVNGNSLTYHAWKLNMSRIQNITEKFGVRVAAGLGQIFTNDFNALAPSLRYYTGGSNSIRGYSYNSLSSHNGVADIGGNTTTELSLELQQEIIPNLKGVVFLDAGKADDKISLSNLHYGTGVGVRYYLPVGYASFDIAYPLRTQFKWTNIKLYLGVNTQF